MKKVFSILSLFLIILLVSCGNKDAERVNKVSVIVPNGSPYLAIAGLLGNDNVDIEVVSGPANLQSVLVSGTHDIVIAPVNLGANLYNKGNSQYQIAHILTTNNAYIVTKNGNNLQTVKDLKDEEVLGFGATGIPGCLLKKIYNLNELDVEKIDFQYSSSANVYSVFAGDTSNSKYALMSEPEISKLVIKDNIEIKTLDLCEELGVEVAQACVYVKPGSDVNDVLKLIEDNVNQLNENPIAYADKVIALDRSFEAMGKDVIVRSIPLTNIVFKEAKSNKIVVETILSILGVSLPNENFYY